MRIVLTVVTLLILIILELAFTDANLLPMVPGFVLAYLCVLLLFLETEQVLWLALVCGLFMDFFSGQPDGVLMISYPLAIAAGWYVGQTFFTERLSTFLLPVYALCATVSFYVAGLLVLTVFALIGWVQMPDWLYFGLHKVPLSIILNMLVLVPVYFFYRLQQQIQKRFWPKHESI
jgi:rod shape-determining protein MreD